MAIIWTKLIPRWGGDTIEPPEAKKDTGYIAGDKPPAKWENWLRKGTYEALDETRDAIEGIDSQFAHHENEIVTKIVTVIRDLSLSGVQSVPLIDSRKPKGFSLFGHVAATNKMFWGFKGGVTDVISTYRDGTNNLFYGSGTEITFSQDATANRTVGTISNITETGFDITWSKIGTGATGNAEIRILMFYHGSDE